MTRNLDRREFLKKTAAAGAFLGAIPSRLLSADEPLSDEDRQPGSEKEGKACSYTPAGKSRVAEISAPGVMIDGHKPDDERIAEMVEKGILELTGEKSLKAAWSQFVNPDDVIGLKINGGGGRVMGTRKAIIDTAIKGMRLAGVGDNNIVVWDQVDFCLTYMGLKINKSKKGVRYVGCTPTLGKEHYMEGKPLPGFETEPIEFPWGRVKLAELVANELTAIINLPIAKDHSCSGVTLALKNISHAVVDQPWHCHGDCCDPYIADINNIPAVRDKMRLHILDGLLCMADGGPSYRSRKQLFLHEKILLSTDPVAVDTIGAEWIRDARADRHYPPLEEAKNAIEEVEGRAPKHIATAAARGLGNDRREKIEIRNVEIPENRPSHTEAAGKKEGES